MQHASVSVIQDQPAPSHQGPRPDGQVIARSTAMRESSIWFGRSPVPMSRC